MKKATIYYTGRNLKLTAAIVKSEDLDVEICIIDNILGDTMIEIIGDKEEIEIFIQIFQMVK